MESIIRWAATAEGLSVQGVLLVNLIVILLSLHRKWMVPGWVHSEVVKERDAYRQAELVRASADKDRLVSLESQVLELTDALKRRQARRASQRGGQ